MFQNCLFQLRKRILCRVPVPSKDPIVCIANSLYSSDDVASQRSAPAQDGPDEGAFEEDGMDGEGPEVVDLTDTEGQTPQVCLVIYHM